MKLRTWFLLPAWLTMAVLFAAPFAIVLAYSFLTRGVYGGIELPWTAESYQRLFDPLYLAILWRSFAMALAATALCFLLAFPAALFIARAARHKNLYLQLVTLPLLYNDGAVLLGLVYGYLPFMVLPIYATLERLDPALVEAAADLGARPLTTVLRIVVPLSRPGIVAGSVLVFIPCLGAYLTPDLLGGGRTVMVGNLVQNQFTTARDWPFGAAVSIALMALVTLVLVLFLRRQSEPLA